MSKSDDRATMIQDLIDLRDAYERVIESWDSCDLNDTRAIEEYPFDKSFNELGLEDWINAEIDELTTIQGEDNK